MEGLITWRQPPASKWIEGDASRVIYTTLHYTTAGTGSRTRTAGPGRRNRKPDPEAGPGRRNRMPDPEAELGRRNRKPESTLHYTTLQQDPEAGGRGRRQRQGAFSSVQEYSHAVFANLIPVCQRRCISKRWRATSITASETLFRIIILHCADIVPSQDTDVT